MHNTDNQSVEYNIHVCHLLQPRLFKYKAKLRILPHKSQYSNHILCLLKISKLKLITKTSQNTIKDKNKQTKNATDGYP